MDLKITDKRENASLSRTEMECVVSFDKAMPSRKQLREALCAASGVAPELLVIVSAKGRFGTNTALVLARAYKSKEALSVERKYLMVRDGLAEKQKTADLHGKSAPIGADGSNREAAKKAPAKK